MAYAVQPRRPARPPPPGRAAGRGRRGRPRCRPAAARRRPRRRSRPSATVCGAGVGIPASQQRGGSARELGLGQLVGVERLERLLDRPRAPVGDQPAYLPSSPRATGSLSDSARPRPNASATAGRRAHGASVPASRGRTSTGSTPTPRPLALSPTRSRCTDDVVPSDVSRLSPRRRGWSRRSPARRGTAAGWRRSRRRRCRG